MVLGFNSWIIEMEKLTNDEIQSAINLIQSCEQAYYELAKQVLKPYYNKREFRKFLVDNVLFPEFYRAFLKLKEYLKENVINPELSAKWHYERIMKYIDKKYKSFVWAGDKQNLRYMYYFFQDKFGDLDTCYKDFVYLRFLYDVYGN